MKKKLTSVSVKVNDKASDNDMPKAINPKTVKKAEIVEPVAAPALHTVVNTGWRSTAPGDPAETVNTGHTPN